MKKGKRNYEELSTEVKNLSLNTPSPAAKTIKRQKKSIKPAQPPVIKEIEDIDLFKSLSQKKPQISDIISILENDVKEHHDIIIRHFLLLFLETFGLKDIANIYSEANVLHLDPKEMMEKIYGFFEITETDFVMPIFQKKGNLLQNINNFFKTMFLDSDKLIYKTRILLTLFSWIQTLSFCKIRIIRQGVLEYLHILMKVSLELYEKTHQDYLRLKGIETNEEKLKSYENRVEFLDKFLDNLFQEVLLSREKDIRPEIRTKFLEILEFLIMKSPQKFLNQQSLNTLDEMLFRKEELENIKSTCISIFCKLYDPEIEKMKAYDNFLCDFLSENQFKERIISIIIANKYKMSAQVFELALKITKKFPDDFSFDENMTKITKLAFHGGKDLRKKIAPWILQRKFEDENVGNEEPVKKIKRLMKFLHELDENNENVEEFDLKYTGFIEEAYEFLVENCKAEDIFKLIRDKAFLTQTLTYQLSSFVFIRIFLEKIKNNINNSEKNKVFYEDFSVLMIKHLEQLLNKYKHDLKLFLQLLKMLSILDENTFKATESLDPMKNLTKTLGTSLVFIKNKDFFEEICTLITTFSKFSTHLKEIAEELINKIVKEETETFQGGYIQLYKNYLEVGLLTNKTELYDQITISLQRIILLLKYFQIPSLLEEEFLVQIKEAFDKHMENKSKEDFGIAELYLGILALAHYWLLRDLFQEPDNISNYTNYFNVRTLYYDRLCESLSSEESFLSFISNSYDLSISLLCLVSNDKLSKLKGIFLNPSDKLFGLILSFIEKMVKNNMEYNPLPKLITLFQYPLKTQKILLSGFGRATIKTILQEIIWNKRPLKNDIFSILKGLKEKEILPQNKGTLIFWRHIQDLLFEISEDHVLSNTQQIELGQELSKMALKVYFISGDAREDAKYLEKYVMFLADSVVRWLDQCSNLLNFHFLTTLVYKPMLEQSYVRKLLEFIKLERRKKEEELEKNGKKLDKMENYHYFERFIVLIEKLSKENKGKEKKEKKNNLEEEREDIDLESKRKEIQNELEEKRKEVVDFEKEEEGTTEVLEYNKEEKIKKRTPRKKIK